jgi:isopenicillin N synthase-like dioxygenase
MSDAVPVIDVAGLASPDPARRQRVAAEIGRASTEVGFYYVTGHGVAPEVVESAVAASRRFFALPMEQRMRVYSGRSNRGYTPLFDSHHPDQKPDATEGFELGYESQDGTAPTIDSPVFAPNRWPDMAEFRDPVVAYYRAVLALGVRLLRAYALHFGLPERHFDALFTMPVADMRLAHYPDSAAVRAVSDFGTGAHTDHGILTLLWQDNCGGLEVCLGDETWLPVPPVPDSLVVNIGELMTRWSNGRLRSTLHRVINRAGRSRFSIPLFLHPNVGTLVDPRSWPGVSDASARFDPVISNEYLASRFSQYRASWTDQPR